MTIEPDRTRADEDFRTDRCPGERVCDGFRPLDATFEYRTLAARGPTQRCDRCAREMHHCIEIAQRFLRESARYIGGIPAAFSGVAGLAAHEAHDLMTTRSQECAELLSNETRSTRDSNAQARRTESREIVRMPQQVIACACVSKGELAGQLALDHSSTQRAAERTERGIEANGILQHRMVAVDG